MEYRHIQRATFISRPNRFIAHVVLEGEGCETVVHVKNTGRCRELLVPGATVFVEKANNPARKTQYDLIAVLKGERLINMDSQAPNPVFAQWAKESGYFEKIILLKPETTYENARFDFYIETEKRKIFVEVKGVTLEEDGVAMFPDAPTQRGVKHTETLIRCMQNGFEAMMVFVIQMKDVSYFTPNNRTHEAFGKILKQAEEAGVTLLALDCHVTPASINARCRVPIQFF